MDKGKTLVITVLLILVKHSVKTCQEVIEHYMERIFGKDNEEELKALNIRDPAYDKLGKLTNFDSYWTVKADLVLYPKPDNTDQNFMFMLMKYTVLNRDPKKSIDIMSSYYKDELPSQKFECFFVKERSTYIVKRVVYYKLEEDYLRLREFSESTEKKYPDVALNVLNTMKDLVGLLKWLHKNKYASPRIDWGNLIRSHDNKILIEDFNMGYSLIENKADGDLENVARDKRKRMKNDKIIMDYLADKMGSKEAFKVAMAIDVKRLADIIKSKVFDIAAAEKAKEYILKKMKDLKIYLPNAITVVTSNNSVTPKQGEQNDVKKTNASNIYLQNGITKVTFKNSVPPKQEEEDNAKKITESKINLPTANTNETSKNVVKKLKNKPNLKMGVDFLFSDNYIQSTVVPENFTLVLNEYLNKQTNFNDLDFYGVLSIILRGMELMRPSESPTEEVEKQLRKFQEIYDKYHKIQI